MSDRTATVSRVTGETDVTATVNIDGAGDADVRTGLAFFDHMLGALARHSAIDIALRCAGDLEVDDHHTIEDSALALGAALDGALADRAGIARFGSAFAPLDESLARCVVDLSGRPASVVELALVRPSIGPVACENITHFFRSLSVSLRAAIHVDVLRGENDHHRAEASFKALALALREAVAPDGRAGVPSTKGVLR